MEGTWGCAGGSTFLPPPCSKLGRAGLKSLTFPSRVPLDSQVQEGTWKGPKRPGSTGLVRPVLSGSATPQPPPPPRPAADCPGHQLHLSTCQTHRSKCMRKRRWDGGCPPSPRTLTPQEARQAWIADCPLPPRLPQPEKGGGAAVPSPPPNNSLSSFHLFPPSSVRLSPAA